MSEAALWLNYCLSGAVAFSVIYWRGWRIVNAMLLGTAVTVALWLAVSLGRGGSLSDPALEAAIVTNACLSLVFAAAGAALAFALRQRSNGG